MRYAHTVRGATDLAGDYAGVAYGAPRSFDGECLEMKIAEVACESLLKVSRQASAVCGV